MSRRRFETDEATTVRNAHGADDDDLLAELLPPLDDHSGPARRMPSSKSAVMIASIVETALRDTPAAAEAKPAAAKAARTAAAPPPRRLIPMLAAALVVAAVVGAAAAVITTRYLAPAQAPQVAPPSPAVPVPAPSVRSPAPEAPEIEMPSESIDTPAPRVKKPAPPAPPREKTLPADAPAEDVLALANQRRKERAWRDADNLYRRVVEQHPKSDAAIVAEVASATLHLEHLGDPAGALAGYRRALKARPSGALGEEARWGIAEAYRAQRMPADEARALRAFVTSHPGSALAPAARKRLAELAP